jgi:hypothetical protein
MKKFIKTINYMKKKIRKKGATTVEKTPIIEQRQRGNNQIFDLREITQTKLLGLV